MKILSVVVPVFNEESTLKTAVMLVLEQKLNDWEKEIIIVDDGSKDKSKEIA